MTAVQPPLWPDGWDIEPCDTPPPRRKAKKRRIDPEAGRAAGGKRLYVPVDKVLIENVKTGSYL